MILNRNLSLLFHNSLKKHMLKYASFKGLYGLKNLNWFAETLILVFIQSSKLILKEKLFNLMKIFAGKSNIYKALKTGFSSIVFVK